MRIAGLLFAGCITNGLIMDRIAHGLYIHAAFDALLSFAAFYFAAKHITVKR